MPNLNMNNFQTRNRTFDPDPLPYRIFIIKLAKRKIVTKFVIRCVCHTEGLKSWQIMKKMTHKNLSIVKKLVHASPRPASNTEVLALMTSKGFYGNEVQK